MMKSVSTQLVTSNNSKEYRNIMSLVPLGGGGGFHNLCFLVMKRNKMKLVNAMSLSEKGNNLYGWSHNHSFFPFFFKFNTGKSSINSEVIRRYNPQIVVQDWNAILNYSLSDSNSKPLI